MTADRDDYDELLSSIAALTERVRQTEREMSDIRQRLDDIDTALIALSRVTDAARAVLRAEQGRS